MESVLCSGIMARTFLRLAFIAALMGRIATKNVTIKATVGQPVIIPCSLSDVKTLNNFYWDQSSPRVYKWDNGNETIHPSYEGRIKVFSAEFDSGNFSMRLSNVGVGDDKKVFTVAGDYIRQNGTPEFGHDPWCTVTLDVSAPYGDPRLTVERTLATCTAGGGYPKSSVSWKGVNKSNAVEMDLEAETCPEKDPTTGTFTLTSSVCVEGLQSVTCSVYDRHADQKKNATLDIPLSHTSAETSGNAGANWWSFFGGVVVGGGVLGGVLVGLAIWCYRNKRQAGRERVERNWSWRSVSRDQDQGPEEAAPPAAPPPPPNTLDG
ncbi:CD276 antigen homolog [Brachionichthys hirsutus]|uniref:CD276 antigen homolog n=1 Tax=Brachionichthys hirsutus TaxID=412623 RepID=UPI0036045192